MLPENQRIALVLSTYHELSYKEIAEVMETSVSSVESLLFRAKNNLRKIMVKTKP
ncbi:MAG TPA: sigma factor-like helix-turn-helix DNA-binding protein [Tenuifilum sp.]|nr:sigma factor-like helix-turn-helix DNA-binding protein [Tenuifilum sp.]